MEWCVCMCVCVCSFNWVIFSLMGQCRKVLLKEKIDRLNDRHPVLKTIALRYMFGLFGTYLLN